MMRFDVEVEYDPARLHPSVIAFPTIAFQDRLEDALRWMDGVCLVQAWPNPSSGAMGGLAIAQKDDDR